MTKELKELVFFGLKVGEVVEKLSDGFQVIGDLGKVIEAAKAAPAGIKGAQLALEEYKGMTDAEALELEQFIVTSFDIKDDVVEAVIEQVLTILVKLHDLANLLK